LLQEPIRLTNDLLLRLLGQADSLDLLRRRFENFFRLRLRFLLRLVVRLADGAAVHVDVNGTEVFAVHSRRRFLGSFEMERRRTGLEQFVEFRAALSAGRRESYQRHYRRFARRLSRRRFVVVNDAIVDVVIVVFFTRPLRLFPGGNVLKLFLFVTAAAVK
jgi:hypothetical protein